MSQLGVVINKMDTVNWSKERFDEIVSKLKIFLRQAGYKEQDLTYIPCSGMSGENLVKPPIEPQLLSWYKGPTVVSVIGRYFDCVFICLFPLDVPNASCFVSILNNQINSACLNVRWINRYVCL